VLEAEENYLMRNLMIAALHPILIILSWTDKEK
jgi:hypothetical protein